MGVIIITELIKTFLIGIFFGTFGTTIGGLIGVNLKSNLKQKDLIAYKIFLMLENNTYMM